MRGGIHSLKWSTLEYLLKILHQLHAITPNTSITGITWQLRQLQTYYNTITAITYYYIEYNRRLRAY